MRCISYSILCREVYYVDARVEKPSSAGLLIFIFVCAFLALSARQHSKIHLARVKSHIKVELIATVRRICSKLIVLLLLLPTLTQRTFCASQKIRFPLQGIPRHRIIHTTYHANITYTPKHLVSLKKPIEQKNVTIHIEA